MRVEIGGYLIETDNLQFILKAKTARKPKKPTDDGEITGVQTIEEDNYKVIAYCGSLESALERITNQVLLDNDDLIEIITILKTIRLQISALRKDIKSVTEV